MILPKTNQPTEKNNLHRNPTQTKLYITETIEKNTGDSQQKYLHSKNEVTNDEK